MTISLVFVEVAGSCSGSRHAISDPGPFLAWDRLQRLRDHSINDGSFVLVSDGIGVVDGILHDVEKYSRMCIFLEV